METDREVSIHFDVFEKSDSPPIRVAVSSDGDDRGGLFIYLAPSTTQCGLTISYDERGVYGVVEPAERGCTLSFPILGQSFQPPQAETDLHVSGTIADFDAFFAGADEFRASMLSSIDALREEAPDDLASGRVSRVVRLDGDQVISEPFGLEAQGAILRALEQELNERRSRIDDVLVLRDLVLDRGPCLQSMGEPNPPEGRG